jgi:hypothetical protein
MISCQVCRRTMRWHNGPIRRSRNPYPSQVFQDWSSKWEESVAHSILARSLFPPMKAVYMCADQPCPSHFSLVIRRRTIHVRMRRNTGATRFTRRLRIGKGRLEGACPRSRMRQPLQPRSKLAARRPAPPAAIGHGGNWSMGWDYNESIRKAKTGISVKTSRWRAHAQVCTTLLSCPLRFGVRHGSWALPSRLRQHIDR